MTDRQQISIDVARALEEDMGSGDISALLIPDNQMLRAKIISREAMVFCGLDWAEMVFRNLDTQVQLQWKVADGDKLDSAQTLVEIQGNARSLLSAERTALNFLQTLSATATQTRAYVQALEGTDCRLLDTRKTLPGLRYAQKYAVHCGGGSNHRMGLYDAFLIKENHIAACGSISKAISTARAMNTGCLLEVEVENLDQLGEALSQKPDRIMLDNFDLLALEKAVQLARPYQIQLEASGNIGLHNIREVARTGVGYISTGAITKSVRAIDLSMLVQEDDSCL